MTANARDLAEFSGFVRQLHQRPEISGHRPPAITNVRAPFYQPAPGMQSLALSTGRSNDLLEVLGDLLWQTLGYTQVRLYPALNPTQSKGTEAAARRALASGGARYPVDLHVLVPAGATGVLAPVAGKVLTYAPQYHRLFVSGSFDAVKLPIESLAIVLSLDFLRTWEKYGDFGFRLSAVDAGLVLGRLFGLARAHFQTRLDFNFNALQLDAVLGLASESQGSYGILHMKAKVEHDGKSAQPETVLTAASAQPIGSRLSLKFRKALELTRSIPLSSRPAHRETFLQFQKPAVTSAIELPVGQPFTETAAIKMRRSRAHAFTGAPLPAGVLRSCIERIQHQLLAAREACEELNLDLPRLLVCALHVSGLAAGIYVVDENTPVLVQLAEGNKGADLFNALLLKSFDLQKSAFVVHICTRRWLASDVRGPRAYRVDQILTGIALDAGTLAVSAKQVSAHAYLGFDADALARLYNLDENGIVGAQLCVGVTAAGCELAGPVLCDTAH
jgi:hypothetical protein